MFRVVIITCIVLLALSLFTYEIFMQRRGKTAEGVLYVQWVGEITQYRLYHNAALCDEIDGHVLGEIKTDELPTCFRLEKEDIVGMSK